MPDWTKLVAAVVAVAVLGPLVIIGGLHLILVVILGGVN